MECRASLSQRIAVVVLLTVWATVMAGLAGGFVPSSMPERMVGWAGLGFLLLGIPLVRLLFVRQAVITLDDQGLNDTRIGLGLIPWSEISTISFTTLRKRPVIQLWLRHESDYLARLSFIRRMLGHAVRALGASPFSINFSFISPGFVPVRDYMLRHVRAKDS